MDPNQYGQDFYNKRKMLYGKQRHTGRSSGMAEAETGAESPVTVKIERNHQEARKRQEKKNSPLQPSERAWPC